MTNADTTNCSTLQPKVVDDTNNDVHLKIIQSNLCNSSACSSNQNQLSNKPKIKIISKHLHNIQSTTINVQPAATTTTTKETIQHSKAGNYNHPSPGPGSNHERCLQTVSENATNINDSSNSYTEIETDSFCIKEEQSNNKHFESTKQSNKNVITSTSTNTNRKETASSLSSSSLPRSDSLVPSTSSSPMKHSSMTRKQIKISSLSPMKSISSSLSYYSSPSSLSSRNKGSKLLKKQSLPSSSSPSSNGRHSLHKEMMIKKKKNSKHHSSSSKKKLHTNKDQSCTKNKVIMQSIVCNLMKNYIPCPSKTHWATTYQANDPCEDRYASLSNVFMTPMATQSSSMSSSSNTLPPLVRMSLFTVLDGHGGAAVAESASKKLLPLVARNICQTLQCEFVSSGQLNVNGKGPKEEVGKNMSAKPQKKRNTKNRYKNYVRRTCTTFYSDDDDDDDEDDFDVEDENSTMTNDSDTPYVLDENCFLIQNSNDVTMDSSEYEDNNKPWYKAPDRLEGDCDDTCPDIDQTDTMSSTGDATNNAQCDDDESNIPHTSSNPSGPTILNESQIKPLRSISADSTVTDLNGPAPHVTDSSSSSSCDSSAASSTLLQHGNDNHYFISDLTSTLQKSFIAFDEEFMNSIDPTKSKQTFVVRNGKWNAGSCCLAVVVIQSLEPLNSSISTSASCNDHKQHENDGEMDDESCDDDDIDFNSNIDEMCKKYIPGKAYMYTAHVGDCRAIMISDKVTHYSSVHEEDDCTSNSDEEEDNDDEQDNNKAINGRRKRKLLEIKTFSNKRRRACSFGDTDVSDDDEEEPTSNINDASNFEPSALSSNLNVVTLTKDHTPYNMTEAALVRQRCNDAPFAIDSSIPGGIKRVAGSLSVSRALGDAYLKTPVLSFDRFKDYAPFITALPEVRSRILGQEDRIIVLASDGVWERVNEESVKNCVGQYYKKRNQIESSGAMSSSSSSSYFSLPSVGLKVNSSKPRTARMRMLPTRSLWEEESQSYSKTAENILSKTHVSDAIVSTVLQKVKKKHKMNSIKSIMDLPKGDCRRNKHDDITNMVIDLEGIIF